MKYFPIGLDLQSKTVNLLEQLFILAETDTYLHLFIILHFIDFERILEDEEAVELLQEATYAVFSPVDLFKMFIHGPPNKGRTLEYFLMNKMSPKAVDTRTRLIRLIDADVGTYADESCVAVETRVDMKIELEQFKKNKAGVESELAEIVSLAPYHQDKIIPPDGDNTLYIMNSKKNQIKKVGEFTLISENELTVKAINISHKIEEEAPDDIRGVYLQFTSAKDMLVAMVELQMISETGLDLLKADIESLKDRAKLLNQISEVENTTKTDDPNSPIIISSPSPPRTRSKRKGTDSTKIPKKKKIKVNYLKQHYLIAKL